MRLGLDRFLLDYWYVWFFYIFLLFNDYWFFILNFGLVIYWSYIVAVLTRINNFLALNYYWIVDWSINSFISISILYFFNWLLLVHWNWLFWGRWFFLDLFRLFRSHRSYFCWLSGWFYVNYFFDRWRLINIRLFFFRRRNVSYISCGLIIFINLLFHFQDLFFWILYIFLRNLSFENIRRLSNGFRLFRWLSLISID